MKKIPPPSLSTAEKELFERLLSGKEAIIKEKEEEISFLRDVLRRLADPL